MTLFVVKGKVVQADDPTQAAQRWVSYIAEVFSARGRELQELVGPVILVQDTNLRNGVVCAGGQLWRVQL